MKPPAVVVPIAAAAHAFLQPSSAERWEHCSGSAWMESQFPDMTDPTERAEGEACHWVMQQVLTTQIEARSMIGIHAPNGSEVTQAMVEAVELLRDDIAACLGPHWRQMVTVEQPVTMRAVHATACWGTPDVRAWQGQSLLVWDLKYGFKRKEVFENRQLVLYAQGAIEAARIEGWDIPIRLAICQPRAYHPDGPLRVWQTTGDALKPLVQRLAMAAEEATSTAPTCRPTPSGCENCKARCGCDALQEAGYRGMDIARQASPRELSDEAAGLELVMLTDAKALIDARLSGLEELVKHRLNNHARIPHWRLGPGRGATTWTKPVEEVLALGRILGLDLAKPAEAVTPLQAKSKGLPESLLLTYSQSVPGATKLMREDNTSVRRIFSA